MRTASFISLIVTLPLAAVELHAAGRDRRRVAGDGEHRDEVIPALRARVADDDARVAERLVRAAGDADAAHDLPVAPLIVVVPGSVTETVFVAGQRRVRRRRPVPGIVRELDRRLAPSPFGTPRRIAVEPLDRLLEIASAARPGDSTPASARGRRGRAPSAPSATDSRRAPGRCRRGSRAGPG